MTAKVTTLPHSSAQWCAPPPADTAHRADRGAVSSPGSGLARREPDPDVLFDLRRSLLCVPDEAAQQRRELRLLKSRLCGVVHPTHVRDTGRTERATLREDQFLLGSLGRVEELESELVRTQIPNGRASGELDACDRRAMRPMPCLVIACALSAFATGRISVPPPGSPPEAYRDCTTSRFDPSFDLGVAVGASLASAGAVYLHYTTGADGGTPLILLPFTAPLAIIPAITSARAWRRVSRCRRVLADNPGLASD